MNFTTSITAIISANTEGIMIVNGHVTPGNCRNVDNNLEFPGVRIHHKAPN